MADDTDVIALEEWAKLMPASDPRRRLLTRSASRLANSAFDREQVTRALWDHWWRDERDVGDRAWNHPDWAKMRALREAEADAVIAACGSSGRDE